MNSFVRGLLALIAGAALTLAFAPVNWWPAAFVLPAFLFLLWQGQSARTAAITGYLFGLGFFGIGVSWVFNSIYEFGHAPAPFAAFLTFLFVITLSLFPALTGWLQNRLLSENSPAWLRYTVLIPALWVAFEWVRGWLLTGFPWLQLGYSQLETPLAGFAPVAGVLFSSWIVAVVAAAITALVVVRGRQRLFFAGLIVLVILLGAGLQKIEWTQAIDDELNVALVQGNIKQENKWERDWLLPTIERYSDATLKQLEKDLVVWPEVALPGRYSLFKPNVLDPLQQHLVASDTSLVFGVLRETEDGLHNALVGLEDETTMYLKRHLVPFGEYIPLRNALTWLKDMVQLPASDISPGKEATLLPVGKYLAAGSICYEDAYGNEIIDMLPQANFLINVSNDAWFGDSLAPHQHLQIARMRALETGRPLLRATNTGVSAIVDYRGGLQSVSPQFEMDVLEGKIQPRTGATPYVSFGNFPVVILMALLLGIGLLLGRRANS